MGYLRVNDTKIYYEIYGEGNALAFLNGIFMSTKSYLNFIPKFSSKYKIILHDFRGQWNSDKPNEISFKKHSDDFYFLLKELNIEKINIVGVSYGGEVALKFVIDYPEKVNSLIIVSSVSEINFELKEKIEKWKEGAKTKNPQKFINSWIDDVYSKVFLDKNYSLLRERLTESLKDFDYEASIKLMDSFLELYSNPLTPYLKNIKVPTLVVAGEFDTLKPVKFSKIINREIEDSELVIIGNSGHAIPFEKKSELETVILGFLEKNKLNL